MPKNASPKTRDAEWYKGTNGSDGASKAPQKDWTPAKFVRGELTDAEKDHCKNQQWKPDEVLDALDNLCTEGYKVTVSWDRGNDCFGAWLVAPQEGHPHSGFILSGRGPSLLSSLAVLMYKHFTKFDAHWPLQDVFEKRDQWG